MENLGNDFTTTLNGGIDGSQTTITVASSTGSPAVNFRIRIDSELMLVTAKSGNDWTVARNIEGTSGAAHSHGANVSHVVTFVGIRNFARENVHPFFPGVESGEVIEVKDRYQMNVVDELLVEGELVVVGQVNVFSLP